MKIIFFEVSKEKQIEYKEYFNGFDVLFYEDKLSIETLNLALDADIIHVFVNSIINKDILDKLPNLKLITTGSTGYDHIDVSYCKEKGIKVAFVPAYGSNTVAEFTFALLLTISRKVYDAYYDLRYGADFSLKGLRGFDLYGKTIGIIGTGKIGKNVIKIALGFGMKVIAFDPFEDKTFAQENNFEYKSLKEVLNNSDVISLHAPYTKENHHLINKESILEMKKGVIIINTARGELIETESLIWGLKENIIAGAGLDVLEGERDLKEEAELITDEELNKNVNYKRLIEDHILIDMQNVIVTPHIAFYTKEAERRITETVVDNIKNFIIGKDSNLVN